MNSDIAEAGVSWLCTKEAGKEITFKLKELIALTLLWSKQVVGSRANIHDSLFKLDW